MFFSEVWEFTRDGGVVSVSHLKPLAERQEKKEGGNGLSWWSNEYFYFSLLNSMLL